MAYVVVALAAFVGGFIFATIRVMVFVRRALCFAMQENRRWFSTLELAEIFGSNIYGGLRELEAQGFVERREEAGGAERGGRPRALYRWRQ